MDREVPFGRVIYGDEALQSIYKQYGDDVSQGKIWQKGYEYLEQEFPNLSYIDYCRVLSENEVNYYLVPEQQQHDLMQQIYDFEEEPGFTPLVSIFTILLIVGCVALLVYIGWNAVKRPAVKSH